MDELKQGNGETAKQLSNLIRVICVIRGWERLICVINGWEGFICVVCGREGFIMVEVGAIRVYPGIISSKCSYHPVNYRQRRAKGRYLPISSIG